MSTSQSFQTQPVRLSITRGELHSDLVVPVGARGCVLFAHGSGSGRHSPRNQFVAQQLQSAGLATLLFDLLTADEERGEHAGAMLRFDVEALAERLGLATDWVRAQWDLPLGYFGASTGAAAALIAAAERGDAIRAVVSRGGRPDLVSPHVLAQVTAPTLLLVGSLDREVLALNRRALANMRGGHRLHVVEGTTHLFEERGALEEVALHARRWFAEQVLGTARA